MLDTELDSGEHDDNNKRSGSGSGEAGGSTAHVTAPEPPQTPEPVWTPEPAQGWQPDLPGVSAGPDAAGPDAARRGKARRGKAGPDETGRGKARRGKAGPDAAGPDETGADAAGADAARRDAAGADAAGADAAGPDAAGADKGATTASGIGSPPASAPVPAATFQPPQVIFQPPEVPAARPSDGDEAAGPESWADEEGGRRRRRRGGRGRSKGADAGAATRDGETQGAAGGVAAGANGGRAGATPRAGDDGAPAEGAKQAETSRSTTRSKRASGSGTGTGSAAAEGAGTDAPARKAGRGASKGAPAETGEDGAGAEKQAPAGSREPKHARGHNGDAGETASQEQAEIDADGADGGEDEAPGTRRRRRRRRRGSTGDAEPAVPDDPPNTVVHVREPRAAAVTDWDEVQSVKGSTRLEAKKQRRREGRDSGRRRPPVLTESEFLARREAVQRMMLIRQKGERIQIAALEDGVLVEHYVDRASHQSMAGNIYLGKVQNVLPSMEAAFVDIGKGRNAVLYAGEINFDASGLEGQPKRIEMVLKSGQSVLVQVTKDPVGHKGARLTNQVSLPGRYLVYVPGASMTGISRKLPATERTRLKQILKKVTPEDAGVIVRTAAEGTGEEELSRDVARLAAQWEDIERKSQSASPPDLLYSEPDLTIRVVRDVFNEDFSELVVAGDDGWDTVNEYVNYVAPHLADRLRRWEQDEDLFSSYRIDEQLAKALERKVWLPSGGSLVVDRTEAMTVIDVNTGKFTGQGGNLEETVTRNNLEAAEEIVRQLRLRDIGGIIVIDFIDMVLESNRELVLRRLLECLARDRTKHQVAEVTSLGLVQMTRKRVGSGLLEAFSQPCECCNGRGLVVSLDLLESAQPGRRAAGAQAGRGGKDDSKGQGKGGGRGRDSRTAAKSPAAQTPAAQAAGGPQAPVAELPAASGEAAADGAPAPGAGMATGDGEAHTPQGSGVQHEAKPSGGRRRRRRSAAANSAGQQDGAANDGPAAAGQQGTAAGEGPAATGQRDAAAGEGPAATGQQEPAAVEAGAGPAAAGADDPAEALPGLSG
jgi:ribonuclease E